jgi:hypothetical protein
MIVMVGLGGLEPPTALLSGAFGRGSHPTVLEHWMRPTDWTARYDTKVIDRLQLLYVYHSKI